MLFQQLLTDKSNANTDWNLGWRSQTLLQSEVAHRNSANKGLVGATTTAPGPLCFMGTLKIRQLTPRFGLQAAYALPHRDVSHPPMQKPGRPSDQLWPDRFFFFWGIDVCFFPGPCGSTRDSHFPVLSSAFQCFPVVAVAQGRRWNRVGLGRSRPPGRIRISYE